MKIAPSQSWLMLLSTACFTAACRSAALEDRHEKSFREVRAGMSILELGRTFPGIYFPDFLDARLFADSKYRARGFGGRLIIGTGRSWDDPGLPFESGRLAGTPKPGVLPKGPSSGKIKQGQSLGEVLAAIPQSVRVFVADAGPRAVIRPDSKLPYELSLRLPDESPMLRGANTRLYVQDVADDGTTAYIFWLQNGTVVRKEQSYTQY